MGVLDESDVLRAGEGDADPVAEGLEGEVDDLEGAGAVELGGEGVVVDGWLLWGERGEGKDKRWRLRERARKSAASFFFSLDIVFAKTTKDDEIEKNASISAVTVPLSRPVRAGRRRATWKKRASGPEEQAREQRREGRGRQIGERRAKISTSTTLSSSASTSSPVLWGVEGRFSWREWNRVRDRIEDGT